MPRSRRGTRRRPRSNPRGTLSVTSDGFGFVQTAEGEFFIPAAKMGGAFDGDLVEIAPSKPNYQRPQPGKDHNKMGKRPSARVVRVLHRAHESVVGRYEVCDPFGVVVPIDHRVPYDIFTMLADNPTIEDGSIVRVRMVAYPGRNSAATGVIEDVLGSPDQPGLDIEAIIARHKLATRFSPQAIELAEDAHVDIEGALSQGYRDIRDRFVFTIDPVDARDFDDAISVEPVEGGVRLGVHIADVSHYVQWGSSLDLDARRRATSVYLVDRVIPMLPEKLSNEICSLAPGVARRCLSVDIVLDDAFDICSVDMYASIIQSQARLSYDQAECYLAAFRRAGTWQEAAADADQEAPPFGAIALSPYAQERVFDALSFLARFSSARASKRHEAGGLDFDKVEARVQLDDAGTPTEVLLRRKTPATSCIEEAMILANECVAQRLVNTKTPGMFRVHEQPAPDALVGLVNVLQEFDYARKVNLEAVAAGNPHALQDVLAHAKGRPEAELVNQLVLRSMQRAEYRATCDGHYGLASQAYCHFTSPIRRYPDLVVHRMIRTLFEGKDETFEAQVDALQSLATHASEMERTAEAAARDSQDLKLVEYMRAFVGQSFVGVISGVATYGLYVQLDNTAEGLLPTSEMGEYFSFDPAAHSLTGSDTARTFRLGQQISVVLHAAPKHATRLEFRLL